MDIHEIIKISILIITAIIGLYQLRVMALSFKGDHERRMKQSTIEYMNVIRKEYIVTNNKLMEEFGVDPIGADQVVQFTKGVGPAQRSEIIREKLKKSPSKSLKPTFLIVKWSV